MITIILQGGLGNQLFQYFFGLATASRLGTGLLLDVSKLQHDSMRQYNLGLFNIKGPLVIGSKPTVHERGLPYDTDLVESIKDGDVLQGYWQSEEYFNNLSRPEILEKFRPQQQVPQLYYEGAIQRIKDAGERSTFLTVRRTDYLRKQDFHGVLQAEYYQSALKLIKEKSGVEPKVFVFSDDPQWCKENLLKDWEVVGTYDQTTATHLGREDLDLHMMSLCRHGVMANSSFSWWGAWLGDGETGRVVVAPKQWFTTTTVDSRDIVPERWHQI